MATTLEFSTLVWVISLFWFVVYWIVGGSVFSLISVTRFLHVHKARFSCLFTLLSIGAAGGAAYMGAQVLVRQSVCMENVRDILDIFPLMFLCVPRLVFSSGLLWFLLLMVVGIGCMFLSRKAEERKNG